MSVELIEVAPGKWRIKRPQLQPARSDLPLPYVISDIMPPTEQVDGKFYTSKREYRAVGKAHGLIEIGTEKLVPKPKGVIDRASKQARRTSIKKAIEQYKSR